jgi:hypothetical protein
MIRRLFISCLMAGSLLATAQDRAPVEPGSLPAPDQAVEPVKPAIEKLDESRFQMGQVVFDHKSREIRFPCKVNMTEGLLEYLVVHQNGKVHESLFVTETSPTHINLALTLLKYRPSRELYPLPNDTGGLSGDFPVVPDDIKASARIRIDVEWSEEGNTKRLPVNDWIQHAVKTTAMPQGPWVYGGSEFYDGQFVPETSGDIAAIFVAQSSLINYPGEDNRDDTVWLAFTKRIPPQGTNVTLVIAPQSGQKSAPAPAKKPAKAASSSNSEKSANPSKTSTTPKS